MSQSSPLERLARGAEESDVAERLAEFVAPVGRLAGAGALGRALRGEDVGHPLHPALVSLPIGAISTAVLLDLTKSDPAVTRRVLGIGLLAAPPTALAGWAEWSGTTGAARRVGAVHATVNLVGLVLCLASWVARGSGRGRLLSAAGLGVMGSAAYLGGHLAYRLGVGVRTAPAADDQEPNGPAGSPSVQ